MDNIGIAFLLTLIAGLSTGIGSLIAFFSKATNYKFLAVSLGFSAGVMIYVSMIEIFPEAVSLLALSHGEKTGTIITIAAFFGGMVFIGIIDKLIPSEANPHEIKDVAEYAAEYTPEESGVIEVLAPDSVSSEVFHAVQGTAPASDKAQKIDASKLMRTGLFTAIAIAIHNFPEGLATFVSAMQSPEIAIPIVVAIAIHNIPEGLAVSIPVYYATGSKRKALIYSFASGLTEPLGALLGFAVLMPIMNDMVFGSVFAAVAGIMVFISIDELLPSAKAYGEHHLSVYGFVAGMAVMALSLWLFI